MKKILLTCLFLCFTILGFSQHRSAELIAKTALKNADFVGVDKYGAMYSIKNNTLYKKTPEKTFHFSSPQLGSLSTVDILNPLKIVLFYKHSNTVVLLDDNLSEIQQFNFNTYQPLKTVGFATKANQNALWIFNIDSQELEIYNYKRRATEAQSLPITGQVIQQKSNFANCWLLTQTALLHYNIYGSFINAYPAENITKIAFYNKTLLVLKEGKLHLINLRTHKMTQLQLPEIGLKDFSLVGENIYLYDGNFVYHYRFNQSN